MVKSCVIRFRVRDHELSSSLIAGVYTHTGLGDPLWVHEGDELEQEIRLGFEEVRGLAFDGSLELLSILTRNTVPSLGLTPVHCRVFQRLVVGTE